MTVDRTLVSKVSMARARNVYTRAERIEMLTKTGRIVEGKALGLPKTRVEKAVKKVKEKKKVEAPADEKKAAAPAAKK